MKNAERPPRPNLSRNRIIEAALDLADAHGVDALSMRALAKALGVEAMSLYNHVRNKDDLIDEMVEMIVGQFRLPAIGGDWRAELTLRAQSIRTALLAHPWATPLIIGRLNIGLNVLSQNNACWGCLVQAGFTYQLADHAINAIDSYIYGFHIREQNFPLAPENYASAARGFLPMIDRDTLPHMAEMTRLVADGEHDGLHQLDFGLDLILQSLAEILERVKGIEPSS